MSGTALAIHHDEPAAAVALACVVGTLWGMAVMAGGLDSLMGQVVAFLLLLPACVAALLLARRHDELGRRLIMLLSPFLGALVWSSLMSWPLLSPDAIAPDLRLPALLGQMAILMALFAGAWLSDRRAGYAMEAMIVLTGYGVLVVALVARMLGPDAIDGVGDAMRHGRFAGMVDNANMACALFGSCALIALGRAIQAGRPAMTVNGLPGLGFWIAFFGLTGGCLLTAARVGNLLLLLGIVVQIAHHYATGAKRTRHAAALITVPAVLLLAAICAPLLWMRAAVAPAGLLDRQWLWAHYWDAAMASPVSGYGLGSFSHVNARYLSDAETIQKLWMVNSPHDFAIGLLLQGGIPALALAIAGMGMMVVPMIRAAMRGLWAAREVALATALALLMAEGLTDIAFDFPITALTIALLAGMLWARSRPGPVGILRSNDVPTRQERRIASA